MEGVVRGIEFDDYPVVGQVHDILVRGDDEGSAESAEVVAVVVRLHIHLAPEDALQIVERGRVAGLGLQGSKHGC